MSRILQDKTPIVGIYWDDSEGACFLAEDGFSFETYIEPGPGGDMVYIAVRRAGTIKARVPAWRVTITYF